jgi:hypothetical protein
VPACDLSPDLSAAFTQDEIGFHARQAFVNHANWWWHFALPGAAWRGYDFPVPHGGRAGGVKSPMFTGSNNVIQRRFCSTGWTDRWTHS